MICILLSVRYSVTAFVAERDVRSILPVANNCGNIHVRFSTFLPRDSYAKRGICRRRVSACLSHSGIVSKRLNVGSRKQRRTIAP